MFIQESICRRTFMHYMQNMIILIVIKTLKTYADYLPVRQHKSVLDWAESEEIKRFLLNNFTRLNPKLRQ